MGVNKYLVDEFSLRDGFSGGCDFITSWKVLQKPNRKTSHDNLDNTDWTPYNGNLHMQGIKVLVNNPCPAVKKENAFEDTMFLIDLLKQAKEKENKQKKDDMIRQMALEQKKKNE